MKGAFPLAEGRSSSRKCGLLRLGVGYFLSVVFDREGVFSRAIQEV